MKQIDNSALLSLAPRELWEHFRQLTLVPRPSGHERGAIDYVRRVAEQHGWPASVDEAGNIVVRVPATPGHERRETVALQGHVDMVPQRRADVTHDFLADPIETIVEGGLVRANGTTLGADDGIGVAAALAVATDPNAKHGPLEILCTVEEETSMKGANGLKPNVLTASMLLNLDSEEEGDLCIGGAGGIDLKATFEGQLVPTADDDVALKVCVDGLRGGHSGCDIHLGRANANKLLTRFLKFAAANYEAMLVDFHGGDMRNAIPREAHAVITIDPDDRDDLLDALEEFEDMFRAEYQFTEPDLRLTAEDVDRPANVLDEQTADDIINALQGLPNGPVRMSAQVPGRVQTSTNLGIVQCHDGRAEALCLLRSFLDTERDDLASSIESIFRLAGANVETGNAYPGWNPQPQSLPLTLVKAAATKVLGREPSVSAIHAGLECGVFAATYPGLPMVSFGPDIVHPHSPDEHVGIDSVERFYRILLATLESVPERQ